MITDIQKKQLEYIDKKQYSNRWINSNKSYSISCKCCNEHKIYHAEGSVITFISNHSGHNTWLKG